MRGSAGAGRVAWFGGRQDGRTVTERGGGGRAAARAAGCGGPDRVRRPGGPGCGRGGRKPSPEEGCAGRRRTASQAFMLIVLVIGVGGPAGPGIRGTGRVRPGCRRPGAVLDLLRRPELTCSYGLSADRLHPGRDRRLLAPQVLRRAVSTARCALTVRPSPPPGQRPPQLRYSARPSVPPPTGPNAAGPLPPRRPTGPARHLRGDRTAMPHHTDTPSAPGGPRWEH